MPPINGKQARAAATFEGKPVVGELVLTLADSTGGGGISDVGGSLVAPGGVGVGSTTSAMQKLDGIALRFVK